MTGTIKKLLILLFCLSLSAVLFCCKETDKATEEEKVTETAPAIEHATDAAETVPAGNEEAEPDPFAYTPPCRECDRVMLVEATKSYIAAQEAGSLSKMALASDAKFKENMSEVTKDKGLWNTPLPVAFHRSIYDVPRCRTFTEVIVTEGKHPYVLALGGQPRIISGEVRLCCFNLIDNL